MRPKSIILTPKDISRFWSHVERSDDLNACWEWRASRARRGYGYFCLRVGPGKVRTVVASRVAWTIANGTDPGDLCVCHTCDNPPCCNPAHLFAGTNLDNIRDRTAKDRSARGDRVHTARLTWESVRDIRRRYGTTPISLAALAREYGVRTQTIWRIIAGKSWKEQLHDGSGGEEVNASASKPRPVLTPQQVRVAALAGCGRTNTDIAERLRVSPTAVSNYLDDIYSRTDMTSRVALVNGLGFWRKPRQIDIEAAAPFATIGARCAAVAALVASGLTNNEIAGRIGVSQAVVRKDITAISTHLGMTGVRRDGRGRISYLWLVFSHGSGAERGTSK